MIKLKFIGVKFLPTDVKYIKKVENVRGESLSNFIRRFVRKELAHLFYLSDDHKKGPEDF